MEDDRSAPQFLTDVILQDAREGEFKLDEDAEDYLCSHGNI